MFNWIWLCRTADPSKSLDTYVNVEFLTWPMISYKREVLFGWVDLLVSFGGIAGLFLGFSLLSGIEILYYFSLRACCMLYRNRDQLYQLAELKLQEPVEFIDLTLTVVKRDAAYIPSNPDDNNDDDEDIPVFRRIDVAEISSHVDGEMPVNDASSENPIRMTVPRHVARFSRKPLTGQVSDNFKPYQNLSAVYQKTFFNHLFSYRSNTTRLCCKQIEQPPATIMLKPQDHSTYHKPKVTEKTTQKNA